MRITYNGRYPAVEVPAVGVTVQRGTPIEIPDETARHLLRQPTWSQAKPVEKTSKKEAD